MNKYILVKQKKSCINQPRKTRLLLLSLGFKKHNRQLFVKNNATTQKIIFKIQHLLFIKKNYI